MKFEQLESRNMLSNFLGWQVHLGSQAEFPEYDMNYDGTVNAADLSPALESEKSWLDDPQEPDNPPTAPQGLLRVTDKMEFLFDDHTVFAVMQNYTGDRVKHVPLEHALWIDVLDVHMQVEGTIVYHQRSNGDLSVQADLTSANAETMLTAYRRNVLVKPNGDVINLSGRTSFRGPNDIYNADIIDDGWMLQRQHHTENTDTIDSDWTEWSHYGQRYRKTGHHETTSENVSSINPLRIIEETETQRKEWTGPYEPTTETLDRNTSTYRIHDQYKLMESSFLVDKDTTTAYDQEAFEGLWLNLARDQDVVNDTTSEEYEVNLTSSMLISRTKEIETEKWNYSFLDATTSLTISEGFGAEALGSTLAYYDSISGMDFTRGFTFDVDHNTTSFSVAHNDANLVFLPIYNGNNVVRYRVTADTYGIDTSDELRDVVEQLRAIEQTLLPEGVTSETYPEIIDAPVST